MTYFNPQSDPILSRFTSKRTATLYPWTSPVDVTSRWDGGSKSDFQLISLSTGETISLQSLSPMGKFNHQNYPTVKPSQVPDGVVLFESGISCGKPMVPRIYVKPCDMAPLLPPSIDLPRPAIIVLSITAGFRPFYRRELRQRVGITDEQWDNESMQLKARKLLNKRGAITNEGRNLVPSQIREWNMKKYLSGEVDF